MEGTSNKARGEANFRMLVAYFDRVGANIPRRADGSADIARIVKDVPLTSRQVIYQNERNRDLCSERFQAAGLPPLASTKPEGGEVRNQTDAAVGDDEKRQLRKRVSQLERELTVARGEIVELRRAAHRFEAIDRHLAETGRLPR